MSIATASRSTAMSFAYGVLLGIDVCIWRDYLAVSWRYDFTLPKLSDVGNFVLGILSSNASPVKRLGDCM